jgi:hypothetical protein
MNMAKDWNKERSATELVSESMADKHNAQVEAERKAKYILLQEESADLNSQLGTIEYLIAYHTEKAISGSNMEMRNRILTELFDLQSSLSFARIEVLRSARKHEG